MEPLPAIEEKIRRRPGNGRKTKKPIYVPDERKYPKFWRKWYEALDASGVFALPFEGAESAIDPFFGFYGKRWHPITKEPQSFHVGVDFTAESKTPVHAVATGVLEYSGFDIQNGNYVVLSHPELLIEDEGMLLSLYMHMRSNAVKFSSYQKMLREISLHTYPELAIKKESTVGVVGDSGNIEGFGSRLHMQIQIKTKTGKIVALDPARVLGILPQENLTQDIIDKSEFRQMRRDFADQINDWNIAWCWDDNILRESNE